MQITVKKIVEIEDGQHTGVILEIKERSGKSKAGLDYHYLDFVIKLEDSDTTIKYGCTPSFSLDGKGEPKSKLAKLWKNLGIEVEGKTINTDDARLMKVKFQTLTEDGFVNVVDNSVKRV